jgi:hypothetical protein
MEDAASCPLGLMSLAQALDVWGNVLCVYVRVLLLIYDLLLFVCSDYASVCACRRP